MHRLGYGHGWMAQGGDWRATVTTALAYMRPRGLLGVHLTMVQLQPTDDEAADTTSDEGGMLDDARRYMQGT